MNVECGMCGRPKPEHAIACDVCDKSVSVVFLVVGEAGDLFVCEECLNSPEKEWTFEETWHER